MAVTGNGGADWTRQNPSQFSAERTMPGISAAGGAVWASSVDGGLFRTGNGGGRWDTSETVWTRASLASTTAIDARSDWACGESGTVLRTFNGGKTWVAQPTGVPENLTSIDSVDSSTAWAVGAPQSATHNSSQHQERENAARDSNALVIWGKPLDLVFRISCVHPAVQ